MKHVFKGFLMPLFLFATSILLQAQEIHKIQMINQQTMEPIIGATYQYGSQSGVSDKMGNISIYFENNKAMELSHLSFGKWQLDSKEVQFAMRDKFYLKRESFIELFPVTVLSLRPSEKPTEKIKIDYQEQLAHDAAAILSQHPTVSTIRKGGNYGFDPVLRGFKYDQLNIVLDGVQSTIAACPNRMDPPTSQMAPNMLDRIEIWNWFWWHH